jgi:2-phosphoxylose phosphatase
MLSLPIGLAVAVAAAAQAALALTPLETFYPPDINSTEYITNTSLGTYGGTYQSPRKSYNTSITYGTYNYCFMPHPRAQEYALPAAISNGTLKGNIVFLEYLQRHQRRTPYNILPGGEVSCIVPAAY